MFINEFKQKKINKVFIQAVIVSLKVKKVLKVNAPDKFVGMKNK